MKFSVRWFLVIIGLIFAVLSIASIMSGDDLLWGLDQFPLTTPPQGMGIVVGIAYITMLGSAGLMWFRAFVVRSMDSTSLRLAVAFSIISTLMHVLMVGYIRIWELGLSTSDLFTAEAWEVASSSSSIRALICLVIGFPIQQWFATRDMDSEKNRWGVIIGGLIALGSLTVVGHTANQPPTWISHGMDFVHGVGASFWFGGLIGLVLFLRHAFREKGSASQAARVLSDFSNYALFCVLSLAISGSIMALMVKDDPFELESAFAKVLSAKLLLVIIPIAFAAYNRFRLMPQLHADPESDSAWSTMKRNVLGELIVIVAILLVTGFLVLQSPVV